jgi:hypothetical protein
MIASILADSSYLLVICGDVQQWWQEELEQLRKENRQLQEELMGCQVESE